MDVLFFWKNNNIKQFGNTVRLNISKIQVMRMGAFTSVIVSGDGYLDLWMNLII